MSVSARVEAFTKSGCMLRVDTESQPQPGIVPQIFPEPLLLRSPVQTLMELEVAERCYSILQVHGVDRRMAGLEYIR